MSATLYTNAFFRITVSWINLFALLCILAYHSYRLCYVQRDRKGSSLRLLKCISFKHLSFVVIISSILPALLQCIVYTPQLSLSDFTCGFVVKFGMVCLAFSKFSLYVFYISQGPKIWQMELDVETRELSSVDPAEIRAT
eukprot:90368_1